VSGLELGLLLIAWMVAGGSPGPATLSIASTSMDTGRRMGVIFALGILAGSAFWGIAAALGMSAVMQANAWLFATLRYVGAAYLLFLAFKSLRSAISPTRALMKKGVSGSPQQVFVRGLLIHLTNPKAVLGWGAVFAITVPPDASVGHVFWMFGFLYGGSVVVFIGYAWLFSTPGIVRVYQRMRAGFELAFAALFGAASVKILTVRLE